jgi:hypothetical protein
MAYTPEFPYTGKQIIIDSGRVLLNAKEDSVFLLGKEAVGLSTEGSIHLNSNENLYINSDKIYLGLKNEESNHEPLVLGFKLQQFINTLAVFLQDVGRDLKDAKDSNNADIGPVQRAGERIIYLSNQLDILKDTIVSEKSFTL